MTNNRPIKKLWEISDFQWWTQPPKKEFIYNPKDWYVRFLQIRDFSSDKNITYIPESNKNRFCEESDILIGRYWASVWKILTWKKWAYNVAIIKTLPNLNIIDKTYFHYYLNSNVFQIPLLKVWDRAAQAWFSKDDIKDFKISLPPLEIQKAIVAKLDEIFAEIDEAIAMTQVNIEKTNEIPYDFLREKFEELEKTYEIFPLLKYVDFIWWSQPEKKFFSYTPKEWHVRLIQIRDYKSDNNMTYIDKNSTKKFCESDDIMIGRYWPPVFQILRWLKWAYNVALMKAIPNKNMLTKDYLFLFLQNPNIQNYIINISQRSAGQSGVNKEALEKYNIPLPPLDKQKEIVKYLDEVFAKTSELKSQYKNKLNELKELKASILQSAFEGKLI